ncbi:50S ribosomal protein L23 [Candidatus Gracilibacteria bacterium]|nr:50S ribosomal protein L23 [Candidatus Gracilibacteria bacterium]MCF7856615.1 50S ribosomal protein L23 [Candidatus Gracilibacteria bacterium]MCF7896915.1 50S ribosomal protein L23 [Candidatus Gracilibacteria bacterium]
MNRLHQILVKPLDTEKAFGGQKIGKFSFVVKNNASKNEIADAVEKYYGVKVKSVCTTKIQPKIRKAGRRKIQKRGIAKKAIVTTVGAKVIDVNKIKV